MKDQRRFIINGNGRFEILNFYGGNVGMGRDIRAVNGAVLPFCDGAFIIDYRRAGFKSAIGKRNAESVNIADIKVIEDTSVCS